MDEEAFVALVAECVEILRQRSPIKTGNLRRDAIRVFYEDGGNTAHIYVDQAIAPYMPYTNEPWVAKRWNGRKNPNEYWFDDSAQAIANHIAKVTKSNIGRADSPVELDIGGLAKEYNVREEDIYINSIYKANEGNIT